jgi:hypothetical protein
VPVVQTKGACSATDISGYITACEQMTSTNTGCQNWFTSAPAGCTACLEPANDAGMGTNTGGLLTDYSSMFNLGGNAPGCVALVDPTNGPACAAKYAPWIQCLANSGCYTCTTNADFQTCGGKIVGMGGACAAEYSAFRTACATDLADGGAFMGGACSDDTQVLSVICGNGSGDGG